MILKNNIQFLSDVLYSKLLSSSNIKINWNISKDNLPVPFYDNNAIHSIYYPLSEYKADSHFKINTNTLYLSLGFGVGYHLISLSKSVKVYSIVFDYEILKTILSKIDISVHFNKNLKIIDVSEIEEYFRRENKQNYYLIINNFYRNYFKNKILEISNVIYNSFLNSKLELNTIKKFGYIWHCNIMKNIVKYYSDYFDFSDLTIQNKIILITGAGYSLEQNINVIKKYRNFFYLAASDTSYQILLKYNITPDSVFSFDCQNISNYHFLEKNKSVRLFGDFTSCLNLKYFRHTLLFSNHPFNKIFQGSNWKTYFLPSHSRNIGYAMIEFFRNYFSEFPIVTVGIDFGIYEYFLYSRNIFLDYLFLSNQCYFETINDKFSKLLYKDKITDIKSKWKTNSYLHQLSSYGTVQNVLSLSTSPYNNFGKISPNDILSLSRGNSKTIKFNFDKIDKVLFLDYIKRYLENDISPLSPLILAKDLDINLYSIMDKYIIKYFY